MCTYLGYGEDYYRADSEKTGCTLYVHVKWTQVPVEDVAADADEVCHAHLLFVCVLIISSVAAIFSAIVSVMIAAVIFILILFLLTLSFSCCFAHTFTFTNFCGTLFHFIHGL